MLATIKGEIDSYTIIVGDFNTILIPMNRASRKKINGTQALNDTLDQIDIIEIYRAFHQKRVDLTFFSSAQGIFSRIGHILGYKSSLGKFLKN